MILRCVDYRGYGIGPLYKSNSRVPYITNESALRFAWSSSIIGLVVEFVVAIDEARVRFTDDAQEFLFAFWLRNHLRN